MDDKKGKIPYMSLGCIREFLVVNLVKADPESADKALD